MSDSPTIGTAGGYPGGVPDSDATAEFPLADPAAGSAASAAGPSAGSATRTGSASVWSTRSRRALDALATGTGRALAATGRAAVRAGVTVRRDPLDWTQVAGGSLVVLGTLLPWISFTVGRMSVSRNGFDYGADGLAMLVLGLAIAVLALLSALRVAVPGLTATAPVRLVLAGSMVLVAVLAWIEVLATGPEEFDIPLRLISGLEITSGAGIWFVLIGAVVAFVAAAVPVVAPRLQRVAAN
jgi:hypothetical protein